MKEHSILMQTDNVKAILDGRKTQTRRVIKPQPIKCGDDHTPNWQSQTLDWVGDKYEGREHFFCYTCGNGLHAYDEWSSRGIICPYGQVGDRLWVRETLRCKRNDPGVGADYITYVSDFSPVLNPNPNQYGPILIRPTWQWKKDTLNSIFMPRWASRIDRTITGLRAERLQEITEEDAIAEGVSYNTTNEYARMRVLSRGQANEDTWPTPQESFRKLWDSLNAKRGYSWDFNPWVWPISFKEVQDK